MNPPDRLALLALYDVRVALTSDGRRLEVTGPANIVEAATPALRLHRDAMLAFLESSRSQHVRSPNDYNE